MEKAETITNQISKIHELQDKLEETVKELNTLKKAHEEIGYVKFL